MPFLPAVLILAAVLLPAADAAHAAPSLSSVEGPVEPGKTLRIRGEGFGEKKRAEPLLFADFEKGLDPTPKGVKRKWDSIQSMEWSKEGPLGAGAAKAADGSGKWTMGINHRYWTKEGERSYIFRRQRLNFMITDKSQNWKIWRMWPEKGNYPNIYMSSSNGRVFVENVGQESGYWSSFNVQTTEWVNEEIFFQASSLNVKDGICRFQCNGTEMASGTVMTRSLKAPEYMVRNYPVHAVVANPDRWSPGWLPSNRVWVDEVYVDDSWSRVMLGDKPLRREGRKWEIQIPVKWADNRIDVTVNAGVFRPGETAYVFVFDANDEANEIGIPVVVGGNTASVAWKSGKEKGTN